MRCLLALTLLSVVAAISGLLAQQHRQKPQTISGEVVCLSCYLTHGAKGESHTKCAVACVNKGLPMGILTKDGKLFVVLEDHANADAYQQLKKFAAKTVTVRGVIATRNGISGIAVQKVSTAVSSSHDPRPSSRKVKYVCPMNCVPPQDKPGNCPKCGMKLVAKQ
ncbi:heavy metal-binding domain-containing protein [Fervidibacter sacchari]